MRDLAEQSVSALRARLSAAVAEASVSSPDAPLPRAGKIVLTPSQKVALLKMRRSDWSKAVVAHLVAFGMGECDGGDYRAFAAIGLAEHRGSFHVLTPQGRWRADQVAIEIARDTGMHVVTYSLTPRHGSAASAKCTCGWGAFRTRAIASYATTLAADVRKHLEHVGEHP